jgi:hypothetical protein
MNNEHTLQDALRLDPSFVPSLDGVAQAWFEARHRFQIEPMRQTQDAYNKATFELGLAFSRWCDEEPEFFEQVRMWIDSHPRD